MRLTKDHSAGAASKSAKRTGSGAGLTLRAKLIGFAAILISIIGMTGAVSYYVVNVLDADLSQDMTMAQALRNHLEADMMHDALRGDVLAALRAGPVASADTKTEIRGDLNDHTEQFQSRIAANQELAISDEIRAALESVTPALQDYIKSAQSIVELALTDLSAAENTFEGFMASFSALEDKMSEVSDRIEAAGQATKDEAVSASRFFQILIISLTLAATAIGVVLSWGLVRQISVPLAQMTGAMRRLANGDKSIEVPARDRRDEIGEMAGAVQIFKDNMVKADQLAAEQEKERESREQRAQAIEKLTKDFDGTVSGVLARLAAATSELQSTADAMSATAEETNRQSSSVANASDQASRNVQTVASAAEQLSASISEIDRQVNQSSQVAGRAVEQAERTNAQVEGLAEAAQKIGDVINMISDIAEQTNLLALNATIEAARAGEAGKGFAVVASEVKNLATQTAKATGDIGQQISDIQAATRDAVEAIKGIMKTISEMNQISTSIASAVEQQGKATGEISSSVQEAASGTHEVNASIGSVNKAAAETGAAASQMKTSTVQLAEQSDHLKAAVERFLTDVRAA